MTKKRETRSLAAFLVCAILLAAACNKHDGGGANAPPGKSCKILSEWDSTWGVNNPQVGINYSFVGQVDYQYDEKGNQTGSKAGNNGKYTDGTSSEAAVSTGFQFDKDGFLTNSLYQRTDISRQGASSSSDFSTSYVYAGGRLVRKITKSAGSPPTIEIETYQWDAKGNLTDDQDTIGGVFDHSYHYDYSNGLLFKVAITDKYSTYSPFIQVNEKGWFIKTIDNGDEYRYEYDAEGEVVRSEYWSNAVPYSAYVYEYDHHNNPGMLEAPSRKGFPTIHGIQRTNYSNIHNFSKETYFKADANGQWQPSGYDQITYTYNSKGYPETLVDEGFNVQGVKTGNGRKSKYTYSDCE